MALPLQKNKHYTYTDYLAWDSDFRYELIDGLPVAMAGASRIHQEAAGEIFNQLYNFSKGKPCKVYTAPFDVRLNAESFDDIVVQPDILVICDQSKLDAKSCIGAPDMIVEILSSSTARHDLFIKYNIYKNAGVHEYWIVDPERKIVQAFRLENGKYTATAYGDSDIAPVHVLDGCNINLVDVFVNL